MREAVSPADSVPAAPAHVAIIMDGNGRWAKARGLPRVAGHRRGADAVRTVIKACVRMGISYLTLYAFSSENWKRPAAEVEDLMGLLRVYIRQELNELVAQRVRLRVIGDRSRLPTDIVPLIQKAEARTEGDWVLTLVVALNYGGRAEIVGAARRLAREAAAGRIDPDAIDEPSFAAGLQTADIPDPDLLIRTSGEQRLSNFLLWQSAYTELVFVPTLWPDFGEPELDAAISEYHRRERRYGAASV